MTAETNVELVRIAAELLSKSPKFMEQIGADEHWPRDMARQIHAMVRILGKPLPEKK